MPNFAKRARLESAMLIIQPSVFGFKDVIAQVVDEMQSDLEDRYLGIETPECPSAAVVEADRDRVLQVKTNLLSIVVNMRLPARASGPASM